MPKLNPSGGGDIGFCCCIPAAIAGLGGRLALVGSVPATATVCRSLFEGFYCLRRFGEGGRGTAPEAAETEKNSDINI